ncbi:hypothetical protein HanLR1_Chr03g0106011 [Helianthus annuus]|nr:hypothetical protein HanLR1_Chr03g0106011 [Helianthus annuus]
MRKPPLPWSRKKSKLQKETTATPSESEIDFGVFSEKTGNWLEKLFKSASGPRVEQVGNVVEDVAAGACAGRGGAHAEGVEIEVESSEATPRQGAIYTKRVRISGGGGASGTRQSPEFQHVQGGSWTTHNPACDDLPHAPHWTLTQGSRMNDLSNCREFYSLCLPPTERLFQKNRHQMDRSTCQEIVKEWQLIVEDTLEFEATKKELAEEREKFNAEKNGLSWRVADAKDKLAKEKQFNANKQKEWETACEGTNQEMKTARDEIVRLKGEKTKTSMNRSAPCIKKERERERGYIQRIAKLEKIAFEKAAESEASEILVEELPRIASGYLHVTFPWYVSFHCLAFLYLVSRFIADHIVKSDELAKYMFELGEVAYNNGRMDGYSERRATVVANEKTDAVEVLKKALGDQDPEAGGAGSSHQV